MISLQAWRASIGCFANNKCGVPKIFYKGHHTSGSTICRSIIYLVLVFVLPLVSTFVYILCLFVLFLIKDIRTFVYCSNTSCTRLMNDSIMYVLNDSCFMFERYYQNVLLLSGDIELNPGPKPCKICPSCEMSVHIKKMVCDCGHRFKNKGSCPSHKHATIKLSNENKKLAMRSKRQLESKEEVLHRREVDKLAHAKKRALETPEKTEERHMVDKLAHAKKRALETPEKTEERHIHDRLAKANKMSLESEEQMLERRSRNLASQQKRQANESEEQMIERRSRNLASQQKRQANESEEQTLERRRSNLVCKRKLKLLETDNQKHIRQYRNKLSQARSRQCSTIDKAIYKFQLKIKVGAEFVCTSCHRLMYRNCVVPCNRGKYSHCDQELLDSVLSSPYISNDGSVWMCNTCDRSLKRGVMPAQCVANNLQLSEIPPELAKLNPLEIRLISLRIPFMKMVALPVGKQRSIHGPAVNVPSKLDTVCTQLPRLPSQSELVPLKFKRKLSYKNHYMYDYVTPDNILNALRWLKINNPLYKDIDINTDWVTQSLHDDDEMLCSLIENPPVTDMDVSEPPPTSPTVVTCNSSSSVDDVITAYSVLSRVARERGFTIHEVPRDGNCLFMAISYQLKHCQIDSDVMRSMLVTYLRDNPYFNDTHCSNFLTSVSSNDGYNADTEAPDEHDSYIASVVNPEEQAQLRWVKYLDRLQNGAWGDHIALQGICNMLEITVEVMQVACNYDTVVTVSPTCGNSSHKVYVGLVMQYHYVGLDPISNTSCVTNIINDCNVENVNVNVNDTQQNSASVNTDELNDDVIAQGDEHNLSITGGPQACSMLSVENPETDNHIYSIAPAEGEKPLSIMFDIDFEEMSNPDKFCVGTGGYFTKRPVHLTFRKYYNQRLLNVDGRFARDLDYLFVAQYVVECKQVFDSAFNYIWRQKPHDGNITAHQAKDPKSLGEYVRQDKAYRFMKNIRGSPPYYQRTFYELLAMIRQLGTPTWFFTVSAADLKWPDMIQVIAKQYNTYYTDDEVAELTFEERCNWIRRNPVAAARHFQYRLNTLFTDFLKSEAHPLGEITDYAIRIEFQQRGSPHAHCVIWVKDAPEFGVDDDSKVCAFIDQYITCNMPTEEGQLKDLVTLLQQHRHSKYCKRSGRCRFHFPHPPSNYTLIAYPSDDDNIADVIDRVSKCLSNVRKLLVEGKTDVSIDELLTLAEVTHTDYKEAISTTTSGNVVVLKREPKDCNVNNYNVHVLKAWQANMDIQYVLNPYACVMYVASYMTKTEKSMGELLRQAATEERTAQLSQQLRKVGTAFLTHREVSAQEAAYRLLSMPMKQLTREVVFIDTSVKSERITVMKSSKFLNELDDNDTDVFCKSMIDRYQHRPHVLASMCLAEFVANYRVKYKSNDDNYDDVLPCEDIDVSSLKTIKLTDNFGTMYKRNREAVIRFHRYSKDSDPKNWYRAKLMLYYPWYNESTDLLGGFESYEEHYNNVHSQIIENETKYSEADIEDINIDNDGPPQHVWDDLAPSTEHNRGHDNEEGTEELSTLEQEDLNDNAAMLNEPCSGPAELANRFESAVNKDIIPADEYRSLMRGLNYKQKEIVMFNCKWCKETVVALKYGRKVKPYHVFVSGPGGVGKSHIIRLIQSDTLKLLKLSGNFEPDDVIVLLTAPTGVAAFNIGGMTLHSAFLLGRNKFSEYQSLSHDRVNTLRLKLSKLKLLIIDEVSMVGCNMLLDIHKRLNEILVQPNNVMFGNVSILAVGDLYQLPPVGQPPLFNTMPDLQLSSLYGSGSLWKELFKMIELHEIMRQRGDSRFIELLCRVRTGECTDNDVNLLKTRVITPDIPNYPTHALHVYRINDAVDKRNTFMLNSLASEDQQYTINACDSVTGQTRHIDLSTVSDKRSETGNLHSVLKIAVGARVMLTVNVNVSDGLVNGARGEIVHIIANADHKVTKILVKFDDPNVGQQAIKCSVYRNTYSNAVPLSKVEVKFYARGRRGSEITRYQFPLTLAWATTIHKVQGLTLNEIVVDMDGSSRFSPGQAYVAFSRVKTLEGLYILNFNASGIKKSAKVHEEMIRLNDNLLNASMTLKCCDLPTNTVTIAFLNVRSIMGKLPDIEADMSLTNASILAFCETWLSPTQDSPNLREGHVVLRCDRTVDNTHGGVLLSIPQSMSPSNVIRINRNGIEVLATTILLSNYTYVQLVLLYRSPSVPIQSLISVLMYMFDIIDCSIPTVVMGDFNEDMSNYYLQSTAESHQTPQLLKLMSDNDYSQLVENPTTDRGTLIDHIYYNKNCDNVILEIADCYYSDHDTVFCSVAI